MFWIARHFDKGFRTGTEQESVEDLFVLQHQWRQAAGECEDHVQIAGREKFLSTRSDPAVPSSGLTLRAMAIAAAVIGDGGTMSAAGALIEMTAECGGTTPANGQQYFDDQHYFSEMGHRDLLCPKLISSHQATDALLPHAKRPPPGGYVQTRLC